MPPPKIESEKPPRMTRNWRDPATIVGVIAAVTALVASLAALRAPPPEEKKATAAYDTLAAELRRQNETIQRMHADQMALRAWLRGFYKAQGVDVQDVAPSQAVTLELRAPEPSAPVVSMLKPATRSSRPAEPVGVRVLTPLPRSPPKPAEPTLPNADAL